jgi:hypothetical protein
MYTANDLVTYNIIAILCYLVTCLIVKKPPGIGAPQKAPSHAGAVQCGASGRANPLSRVFVCVSRDTGMGKHKEHNGIVIEKSRRAYSNGLNECLKQVLFVCPNTRVR